jgi:integrase
MLQQLTAVFARQTAPPTFAALAAEWVTQFSERHHRPGWHAAVKRILRRDVLPILGERRCDRIPRKDIAQLVSGIAVVGYASKANHVLITIRGVLAWGLETGRLDLPGNPARDIRRQRTKPRERGLSPDELRLVWEGLKGLGDYEPVIKPILSDRLAPTGDWQPQMVRAECRSAPSRHPGFADQE